MLVRGGEITPASTCPACKPTSTAVTSPSWRSPTSRSGTRPQRSSASSIAECVDEPMRVMPIVLPRSSCGLVMLGCVITE